MGKERSCKSFKAVSPDCCSHNVIYCSCLLFFLNSSFDSSMLFCFCHRKNFNVSFHFFSYHFKTIVVIFKIPPCFPFFVVKCNENEEIDINPHYKSHRTFLFTIVYFSYCSNLKLHFQLALAETITKTKEEKVERRQHCE